MQGIISDNLSLQVSTFTLPHTTTQAYNPFWGEGAAAVGNLSDLNTALKTIFIESLAREKIKNKRT
jgi:hypothetical protein